MRHTEARDATARQVRDLGPWFQNMTIGGVQTAPDHFLGNYPQDKWEGFAHVLPADLQGRSVLEIGCNAGFYAIEMKLRGAGEVVAIDHDERYLEQARFAARERGQDIDFRNMSVYEIARLQRRFDLVLFMGVFYHLRHPLLALDLIHEHVADDLLLFQSLSRGSGEILPVAEDYPISEWDTFDRHDFPKMHFVERRYAGDPTNWFIPNAAAMEAMLRSAGFQPEARPEREVYLCRKVERQPYVERPPC
jgi:tRNA (mo5U34)-methyltransferase